MEAYLEAFVAAETVLARAMGRELRAFMGEENVQSVPMDDQLQAARTIAEIYAEDQGMPVTSELVDEFLHDAKGDALEAWWAVEGNHRILGHRDEMRAYIERRTGRPLPV